MATFFIADYPQTRFDSVYREAAVLLHCRDPKGAAVHCPWMVVDDDTALLLGRELQGFPKKLASIELEQHGEWVTGKVIRRGVEVLRIEAKPSEPDRSHAPLFARRVVNAIGIPALGMKLIELAPTQELVHSAWRGEAKLSVASSHRDPLGDLQAATSAEARWLELDFAEVGSGQPEILCDVDPGWVARRFVPRLL
jgi:acetoacetate decarboxylase